MHGDELLFTVGNLPVIRELIARDDLVRADDYVTNLTHSVEEDELFGSIQGAWSTFVENG